MLSTITRDLILPTAAVVADIGRMGSKTKRGMAGGGLDRNHEGADSE